MAAQRRRTVQKDIILQVVTSMYNHPCADAIYEEVLKNHPHISRATVYRNLNQMAEEGLVFRVKLPDGADAYDFRVDPHYHVRCSCCGNVFDVDMPYMDDLTRSIMDTKGFDFQGHTIVFEGTCPGCRTAKQQII